MGSAGGPAPLFLPGVAAAPSPPRPAKRFPACQPSRGFAFCPGFGATAGGTRQHREGGRRSRTGAGSAGPQAGTHRGLRGCNRGRRRRPALRLPRDSRPERPSSRREEAAGGVRGPPTPPPEPAETCCPARECRGASPGAGPTATTTHLFDFLPPLPDVGVGGLLPHGADGLAEKALGQPGGTRLLPAAGVLQKFLLVLADVSADLLGQLLQRLLGLPQSPLVVRADPLQAARPARGRRRRRAASGLRRGAGLPAGRRRRRLQGGRVEEDAAEKLGGVRQEKDGPEAEGDEGAEHQQQHELLRQPERAGARRLPAPAARAAARGAAQRPRPHRATEERQQAGGGHDLRAASAPRCAPRRRRAGTAPHRTARLRRPLPASAAQSFPWRTRQLFPSPRPRSLCSPAGSARQRLRGGRCQLQPMLPPGRRRRGCRSPLRPRGTAGQPGAGRAGAGPPPAQWRGGRGAGAAGPRVPGLSLGMRCPGRPRSPAAAGERQRRGAPASVPRAALARGGRVRGTGWCRRRALAHPRAHWCAHTHARVRPQGRAAGACALTGAHAVAGGARRAGGGARGAGARRGRERLLTRRVG